MELCSERRPLMCAAAACAAHRGRLQAGSPAQARLPAACWGTVACMDLRQERSKQAERAGMQCRSGPPTAAAPRPNRLPTARPLLPFARAVFLHVEAARRSQSKGCGVGGAEASGESSGSRSVESVLRSGSVVGWPLARGSAAPARRRRPAAGASGRRSCRGGRLLLSYLEARASIIWRKKLLRCSRAAEGRGKAAALQQWQRRRMGAAARPGSQPPALLSSSLLSPAPPQT